MNLLTIIRSTMRDMRGVTEIGLKCESSVGCGTLGMGVINALFQRKGGLSWVQVRLTIWVMMGVSSTEQNLNSQ